MLPHVNSEKTPKPKNESSTSLSTLTQERATESNAIQIPQITLPKGGGGLKGIDEKFQVNAANGTASFSIPLPFSPNRNGFNPELTLSYNSGTGNSLFGIGWDLSTMSIQRRTDKNLPCYFDTNQTEQLDLEDGFMFSGAEELVPHLIEAGDIWKVKQETQGKHTIRTYRPRIEGTFSHIERIHHPDRGYYWRVTSRDNVTTFFGYSDDCRVADPKDPAKIFTWLPEFSFDDKGSWIWYGYKAENLENVDNEVFEKNRFNSNAPFTNRHLKRIKYGNAQAYYIDESKPYELQLPQYAAHHFEVVFDYGEHGTLVPTLQEDIKWPSRSDAFSSYRSGFDLRTYRLCRRVLLFHTFPTLNEGATTLVRSLDFEYLSTEELKKKSDRPAECTYLISIEQKGYVHKADRTYSMKALPKMTFDYQWLHWNTDEVKTVSAENLVHAPTGLAGNYQWVDLYNEGINGILSEQANAWYYKSNLGVDAEGNAQFTPAHLVMPKPSFIGLANGVLQLQDLDADGRKQITVNTPGLQGYFELNDAGEWQPFKAFLKTLNIDLRDPNVRMLDLNGDGKPEVVLSDQGAFWCWKNEGKMGYDAPELALKPYDEEKGPAILFADPEQRIFLADMSGDGLTDIVRIRNSEVCYWANLGYGRFSAKISMSNAPRFDSPEQFNPAYLQLADISGTGATDIIYLGKNKFSAYLNLSGNAWSKATEVAPFFPTEQPNKVSVIDLLGNGTACIVWSSELPAYRQAPMRYLDLMGGKKPHIMLSHENGFGKKTEVEYKSSTHFYLKDKLEGTPWVTKLAFPVQVVSRTMVSDLVTGARFVNRYTYHHGYYDHAEREFRGFGRVDQYDTEDYENWKTLDCSNGQQGAIHHEPPVLTRTWFHTGAYMGQDRILKQYEKEYWYHTAKQPGLKDDVLKDAYLDVTGDVKTTTAEEEREAVRACKGMALRQEIFALDGSDKEKIPYTVATHTCHIRPLQPRQDKRNAVFIVLESESIQYTYERKPKDVRVAHTMNLELDQYANVTKAVSIVYGRKKAEQSTLPNYGFTNNFQAAHQDRLNTEQGKTHVILTENDFTNDLTNNPAYYRLPLPCQVKTFECQGLTTQNTYFSIEEVDTWLAQAGYLPYENTGDDGKRLIEQVQTLYRNNDLDAPLPLGKLQSLALPWEAYQLAFTPKILDGLYGVHLPASERDNILATEAKYEKREENNYWISFGKPIFIHKTDVYWGTKKIAAARTATQVKEEFYLPMGYEDPFESKIWVAFDSRLMYIETASDAMGNQTRVEDFDFHTLSPRKLEDINGNFSEVQTDELGMLVATAVYGKNGEGDTLHNGNWVYDEPRIAAFFADPHAEAPNLLSTATACMVYDFSSQPSKVASIVRETHQSALGIGQTTKFQISIEYSDGLGNGALKKIQAEPGERNTALRWIGNGRTVLNNKGKPIKQYEPYFSNTQNYESEKDGIRNQGFPSVLYYDAVGRNIKTVLPDGTFTKVEFDAWEQRSFDQNDNTPSSVHFDTPAIIYLDSLGRPFFSIAHNRWNKPIGNSTQLTEEYYPTYVDLDIEGNVHKVMDARNNPVMTYKYDMLGHRLYQLGMDNGERWMLNDCMGKPVKVWDENGIKNPDGTISNRELRILTTDYDGLHRPNNTFLEINGRHPKYVIERIAYDAAENGKGQIYTHQEGSVQTTNVRYDFKGNLLETRKQFPLDEKAEIINWDWNTPPQYDPTIYTLITEYDALNRMSRMYNWHFENTHRETRVAVYLPKYSERGVLVSEDLVVNALKTPTGYTSGTKTTVVKDITYDAKGQRTRMRRGNDTTTRYQYDEKTFRLTQLRTTRPQYDPAFPVYKSGLKDNQVLQQLYYTYDPVGNIAEIYDDAYEPVFFNGQKVLPQNTYRYDALYRLIEARGREHHQLPMPEQQDFDWGPPTNSPIADTNLRAYEELFEYDGVGNILNMHHIANGGSWTRNYQYAKDSNRLLATEKGSSLNYDFYVDTPTLATQYRYDLHGNMLNLHHTTQNHITWDYRDMIQHYNLQGGGDAWYQYSNDKERSRKVIVKGNIKEERLYLGGMERYRRWESGSLVEEIETLHVFEGEQRILMVETVLVENSSFITHYSSLFRYQYSNHLGSATLEIDDAARIVTYEEYHPYGTTAYQAKNAAVQCAAKRYRYTGMERDEETGLAYHSARYYLVWLGRWGSCDPKSPQEDVNSYKYVQDNPIKFIDLDGMQTMPMSSAQEKIMLKYIEDNAKFHFPPVFTKPIEDPTIVLRNMPDGSWAIGGNSDLKHEAAIMSRQIEFERTMQTMRNIAGGIAGTVGYAIDGDRGSDIGAAFDQLLFVAGQTAAASQAHDALNRSGVTQRAPVTMAKPSPNGQKGVHVGAHTTNNVIDPAGIPAPAQKLLPAPAKINIGNKLGEAREAVVAKQIGGIRTKELPGSKGRDYKLKIPGFSNSLEIDVVGKQGEFVLVGGPMKTLLETSNSLKALKNYAEYYNTQGLAYFEEGTSVEVLNEAKSILGPSNVHTFKRPDGF